eukprot:2044350-Amphidinium_carterae.1
MAVAKALLVGVGVVGIAAARREPVQCEYLVLQPAATTPSGPIVTLQPTASPAEAALHAAVPTC